jgi:uncharacterized YigZ family protein
MKSIMTFSFKTIKTANEAEFKEKGSRFIGYLFPFEREHDLKSSIELLKNKHPKASHFCFAYRIGNEGNIFRSSDDGEPSGTAGKPILNTILSKNLTNVLVIVVRYFGGTLLGVPGLIHAYKQASIMVIESAEVETIHLKESFIFKFSFENLNDLMRYVKEYHLTILKQEYEETCIFEIEIKSSEAEEILGKFQNLRSFEITPSKQD